MNCNYCGNKATRIGLCNTHYQRRWWRKKHGVPYDNLNVSGREKRAACKVCGKPRDLKLSTAICREHYNKMQRARYYSMRKLKK
jgi:hypothetical protein